MPNAAPTATPANNPKSTFPDFIYPYFLVTNIYLKGPSALDNPQYYRNDGNDKQDVY
jgi:hypothetical protein